MSLNAPTLTLEAVLDRHGITDPNQRRRVRREAQRRLEERATKAAVRVLSAEALGQGWIPPCSSLELSGRETDFPLPIPHSAYSRVLTWIRGRLDFSVRELMRASNFVDSASDARALLNGLVAQGEIEVLEPPLRWPGELGRPKGTRFRAVKGLSRDVNSPASNATRAPAVVAPAQVDDLDWTFLSSDTI